MPPSERIHSHDCAIEINSRHGCTCQPSERRGFARVEVEPQDHGPDMAVIVLSNGERFELVEDYEPDDLIDFVEGSINAAVAKEVQAERERALEEAALKIEEMFGGGTLGSDAIRGLKGGEGK